LFLLADRNDTSLLQVQTLTTRSYIIKFNTGLRRKEKEKSMSPDRNDASLLQVQTPTTPNTHQGSSVWRIVLILADRNDTSLLQVQTLTTRYYVADRNDITTVQTLTTPSSHQWNRLAYF
jgi:hypothetical protein